MTARRRLRRRLSRRLYRALYRLYRLVLPTAVGPGPVDPGALRRVLVLANYQVGDLVVATPALTYLREAAPGARVDVLVSPRNAALLAGDPRVDRVLLHEPRTDPWWPLVRRLRAERYDLVVNFVLPHHLREGALTALVAGRRAARVTPFRPSQWWGFFTHLPRVPGFDRRYMAERLLHAVRAAVRRGPPPDLASVERAPAEYPVALAVDRAAAERAAAFLRAAARAHGGGPFVAVNAWARDAVRTLEVAQVGAALAILAERHPGLGFVLTPPPGAEEDAARMLADARARLAAARGDARGATPCDEPRLLVFPPAPTLADLVALLGHAAAVVSPDTANIHLAAALGRPVLALFATVATACPAHWLPPGVPHRAVLLGDGQPLSALAPAAIADWFDVLWAELPAADQLQECDGVGERVDGLRVRRAAGSATAASSAVAARS